MATINPRFQSPSVSLIAQGLLATLLLLAVGRFQQLFELAIFAEWLFYMLTATTVFVYRRKQPHAVRPYRVWGYPVLPALFVVAAGILLFYSYAENLKNSLIGTGIILLGIPLFEALKRQHHA
jgi:APA family basic amino acid/polyamine antiporter